MQSTSTVKVKAANRDSRGNVLLDADLGLLT
jgi:hypothetical protein